MSVVAPTVPEIGYALQFDNASDPILYIGQAPTGVPTSIAKWQIMRINVTTGVVIQWADGNDLFDNVWNDRTSLSYA